MSEQSIRHHKTHYAKNRQSVIEKNRARKDQIYKWYQELKSTLVCSRCPENHPACLHFHHVKPKTKSASVALGVANGWSKETILKEISKCIVLCANCHAKQHAEDRAGLVLTAA